MDRSGIKTAVLAELIRIAPELEPSGVASAKPLRDQVDLDSMDWLNFLVALHEKLKIDIPESEYANLGTLDQIVDYVVRHIDSLLRIDVRYGTPGAGRQLVAHRKKSPQYVEFAWPSISASAARQSSTSRPGSRFRSS
jgi:acyl carrier protein